MMMLLFGWSLWETTSVVSEAEKTKLADYAYRMYDYTGYFSESGGYSWIRAHDQFYDLFNQQLIFNFVGKNVSSTVEINNKLKVNFDPLVMKKVLPGICWSIDSETLGGFSVVVSRESPPSKGSESYETEGAYKVGFQYRKKIQDFTVSFNLANYHKEKYNEPTSAVFTLTPSYPLPEPAVYLRIADSDTSDGWGGQFHAVKVVFLNESGIEIDSIEYSAGDSSEANYVIKNTGQWGGTYWFMDGSAEYIAKFPVLPDAKSVYIILKSAGDERLVQISFDGENFYTVQDDLLSKEAYSNIGVEWDAVFVDTDADPDLPSTWNDSPVYTDIYGGLSDAFGVKITIWKTVVGASLKGKVGLIDPWNINLILSFSNMTEKTATVSGYTTISASAYYIRASKEFLAKFGILEPGFEYFMLSRNFDASDFVDSKVDFEALQKYPPEDGELPEILLPNLLDFNTNGVMDSYEDFYIVDSPLPVYFEDSDYNLNMIADNFEISPLPDYYGKLPYHTGWHIWFYYSPSTLFDFQIGRLWEKHVSYGKTMGLWYLNGKFAYSFGPVDTLLFNRVYLAQRSFWDECSGWIDGFDNDLDGEVDEEDELSASLSPLSSWFEKAFIYKFLGRVNISTSIGLKPGLRFALLRHFDLENSRTRGIRAVGGTVEFCRAICDWLKLRAYVVVDDTAWFISSASYSLLQGTGGAVFSVDPGMGFRVNVGSLAVYRNYSYLPYNIVRNVYLLEGIGRINYKGKDFLVKIGYKLWRNMEVPGETGGWESRTFVRAYFFW